MPAQALRYDDWCVKNCAAKPPHCPDNLCVCKAPEDPDPDDEVTLSQRGGEGDEATWQQGFDRPRATDWKDWMKTMEEKQRTKGDQGAQAILGSPQQYQLRGRNYHDGAQRLHSRMSSVQ